MVKYENKLSKIFQIKMFLKIYSTWFFINSNKIINFLLKILLKFMESIKNLIKFQSLNKKNYKN